MYVYIYIYIYIYITYSCGQFYGLLQFSVKTRTQDELKEFYQQADEAATHSDWQRQFGVTTTKVSVSPEQLAETIMLPQPG